MLIFKNLKAKGKNEVEIIIDNRDIVKAQEALKTSFYGSKDAYRWEKSKSLICNKRDLDDILSTFEIWNISYEII